MRLPTIAGGLYKRAVALVERQLAQRNGASTGQTPATEVPAPVAAQAEAPVPAQPEAPGLPESLKPYVVTLHGKWFVQYTGLLLLAHERGLVSLKAHFISVTPELALAEAEATFADGKTYGECADATPGNVGATVKAHYPRMALTRAKSRTLRDALQIGIAALEELADE